MEQIDGSALFQVNPAPATGCPSVSSATAVRWTVSPTRTVSAPGVTTTAESGGSTIGPTGLAELHSQPPTKAIAINDIRTSRGAARRERAVIERSFMRTL